MAAEVKAAKGIDAKLIEGRGGIFQVRQDGNLIYDKAKTGRFPGAGEVAGALG